MATMVQGQPRVGYDEKETTTKTKEGVASATTVALGAAGTVALAIIGLAGGVPAAMMAVGTIVFGAALFFQAGRVITRYDRLVRDASGRESFTSRPMVGAGMSAEALGGLAGMALGILAVLGFVPTMLCAIAAIVYGAALLFGGIGTTRFHTVRHEHYGLSPTTRQALSETVKLSSGGEAFAGIGAIVLGILSLLGFAPVTLVLV